MMDKWTGRKNRKTLMMITGFGNYFPLVSSNIVVIIIMGTIIANVPFVDCPFDFLGDFSLVKLIVTIYEFSNSSVY
jgi:hypothetical protein